MGAFLVRRLLLMIPTFVGVTLFTFSMVHLIPGDYIDMVYGERSATPERRAQLEAQLGFDRPLPIQYLRYLGNLLEGDLGTSLYNKAPVIDEFLIRFPATVELSLVAMSLAILIGLPAGIIAGVKRKSVFDHTLMGVALTGYSMPIFWWGLLLIFLVSVNLGWTPVSGRISVIYYFDRPTGFMLIDAALSGQKGAFISAVRHLILPAIVLATIPLAVIARFTRSAMIEVLSDDYIRTARAKGLSAFRVVNIHALRNALIPVITVIGLQISIALAGAILTETIFAWPGIGKWIVDSVTRRDYPIIQGGVLLISFTVIFLNLFVDVLYGVINPRIRHA